MYVIAIVVAIALFILFFTSKRERNLAERKGIWKILDKMSSLIRRKYLEAIGVITKGKYSGKENRAGPNVDGLLEQLMPGENLVNLRETYIIQKISMSILIVIIGTIIGTIISYTSQRDAIVIDSNGGIARDGYTGISKEISLTASTDNSSDTISFTLQPRMLTADEIEELLPQFHEDLGNCLKAENNSLSCISLPVNPVVRLEKYPFSIRWGTSDYSCISPSTGKVTEVDKATNVFMTAYVKYGNISWEEKYELTIVPKEYSEREDIIRGITSEVVVSEEMMREDEYLILPKEYAGKSIQWSGVVHDNSVLIWSLVVVVAVFIFFIADKDLGKKVEEKKKNMKEAYAGVVRKFALYIGAGMTVRASFLKIASDAVDKNDKNPIYLEMLYTVRELKSGISEEEAYERFGRRTGIQEYIRMSTLLQQNIKRGSTNLLGRLKEEAENASLERLQDCRKRGEEASTKLLIPMVMMLAVVMVMIMFPAFSSMNL